jgi:hypothetical protein
VSIKELPVETLRKILNELYAVNAQELWPAELGPTPTSRIIAWLAVCKKWTPLIKELLFRVVALSNVERLEIFADAACREPHLARCVESLYLYDGGLNNCSSLFSVPFLRLAKLELVDVCIAQVDPLFSISAQSIKELTLTGVLFANAISVQSFLCGMKNLKTLSIHGTPGEKHLKIMLDIVGDHLEAFSIRGVYIRDIGALLAAMPNVKKLKLQISSSNSWRSLSPYAIPQSCTHVDLQSWHIQFVFDFMAALIDSDYLPYLEAFPRIIWRPEAHDLQSALTTIAFRTIKDLTAVSLRNRNLKWTLLESEGTILRNTSNAPHDVNMAQ